MVINTPARMYKQADTNNGTSPGVQTQTHIPQQLNIPENPTKPIDPTPEYVNYAHM